MIAGIRRKRRRNASASVYKPFCQFPLDAAEETYKRIIAVLVKMVMLRHSIAFATFPPSVYVLSPLPRTSSP